MIKTLRITSIIAAIAATVLLVLSTVYGVRSDPKIEEFLKEPGVVEKYISAKDQRPAPKNTESPLVKAAVDYTEHINPTPPPAPKVPEGTPVAQGSAAPAPPVPVAVKFDIIATSYYASRPEQSFVLIDEAGKGLHWVKQGSTVGRITIESVKDGAIVVRDGQRTSEMTVKVQENWRTLLKNPPPLTKPGAVSTSPVSSPTAATTTRQRPESPVQPSPVTTPSNTSRTSSPTMSGRRTRSGPIPPASERITSPAQPAPVDIQPPSVVESTSPPQEIEVPLPEESPAVKEKSAKIDKLASEIGASEMTKDEEKKMDELFKQIEELGKMREAEGVNDVNK